MNSRFFRSSLGKKYVMAFTGCLLFVFVLGHLAGNLQVFLGREALNAYGHFLQNTKALLWTVRVGLLVLVGLHIWSAIELSRENKRARPEAYAVYVASKASYASRTMLMSGLIVLAFIIYHLLHYTVQVPGVNLIGQTAALPTGSFVDLVDTQQRHDVFGMMIVGFSNVWVSAFYVIGVGLLCLHLSHGISSMFQSMGFRCSSPWWNKVASAVAVVIFAGYISIPLAVLLGYGRNGP